MNALANANTYITRARNQGYRDAEDSLSARDIWPCPEIKDRRRRRKAFGSLRYFLETYFPSTFYLGWSPDHLRVISRLEEVISDGGQYALAMPRGTGKTAITERASMWAVLTGRRRFCVPVAASASLAEQMLGRVKAELEFNERLLEDFPRAIYPIRRLEGQSKRCVGQLYEGARTAITWQKNRVVFPTMPAVEDDRGDGGENEACGSVIHVAGLEGAIRGLSHVDSAGNLIRPDLLLVDDPQDRESAKSMIQTRSRMEILNGDLMGLAGPDSRIAALMTCTVICKKDLADQCLDNAAQPSWQGERYRLVNRWSDRPDLWEEYETLRAEGFLPGGDRGVKATNFYRRNRKAMDSGCDVPWGGRKGPGELSAIQAAYNLRIDRGEDEFNSEYQNDPKDLSKSLDSLDPVLIAARLNGFDRGIAPPEVEKITAFIDVGQSLLWYAVVGWTEDFGGEILDYGAFPDQRVRMFLSRQADPSLEDRYPHRESAEAIVHSGLTDLVGRIMDREWERSDGGRIPVSRALIDSGWFTDLVRLFIRGSKHRDRLSPSKGIGIGPGRTAIADYRKRPGEKIGDGWILGVAGPDRLRLLRFDANHWKTRIASMLVRPSGQKGGISLFGSRPVEHELLALHLSSEYPELQESMGNSVNVWKRFPDRENHLLDCVVGAAVAASVEGLGPLAGFRPQRAVSQKKEGGAWAAFRARQAARGGGQVR